MAGEWGQPSDECHSPPLQCHAVEEDVDELSAKLEEGTTYHVDNTMPQNSLRRCYQYIHHCRLLDPAMDQQLP